MLGIILIVASFPLQTVKLNNELAKLFDLDVAVIVGTIGVILLLWTAIESFYTGPLRKIIDDRNNALERTFSEAENLRTEMATMRSDYEQRLVASEAAAREQIQAAFRKAQEDADALRKQAEAQAEAYKKQVMEDIDRERNRIVTQLRLQVVDLTLQATERLVGESVDSDKNRKLVAEFIDKIEVKA